MRECCTLFHNQFFDRGFLRLSLCRGQGRSKDISAEREACNGAVEVRLETFVATGEQLGDAVT